MGEKGIGGEERGGGVELVGWLTLCCTIISVLSVKHISDPLRQIIRIPRLETCKAKCAHPAPALSTNGQ